MTTTEELARFVQDVSAGKFSEDTQEELKKRVLDSVGIGVNALGHEPVMFLADKLEYANDITNPFQENMQEERKTLAEIESLGAVSELKTLW